MKRFKPFQVVLIKSYEGLNIGNVYKVIGIEGEYYNIKGVGIIHESFFITNYEDY